jgi:hypothetical protein
MNTPVDAGTSDAGTDAGMPGGQISTTYPAFKPDVPQVVARGGPVLADPVVVPVFFANDDMSADGFVH